MDRHRNTNLKLFLTATLALSAIIGLALTGCSPQETATLTQKAASPIAADQAKPSVSPTAATTTSISRATNLLILHTNDVAGYVDPCG